MKISPPNFTAPVVKQAATALEKTVAAEKVYIAEKVVRSKPVEKTVNWLLVAKNAMWFGIISVTIKDFVGMLAYYYQSLTNQKIPPEKRKYVASYELMNGMINCFMPFVLGLGIQNKKVQDEFAYHLFKPYYVDKKVLAAAVGKEKDILIKRAETYATCREGLGKFSGLVLATIISKRLIAPFLAGPLAAKYKKKFLSAGNTPKPPAAPNALPVSSPKYQ